MAWFQEWFGEEYLELYSYRDATEARRDAGFFRAHFGALDGPVLDLACGNGRHVSELRCAGYRTVGCDLSFTLLHNGIAEYGPMPLVRSDMRSLPFRSATFAGLVNFFTSFGYFSDEAENAQVVREMSRVLRAGAVFLFDYLNVAHELQKLILREKRGDMLIERWYDASDHSFNKRITIGQKRFLERVRGYDLGEIMAMFTASGLGIQNVFGDFSGEKFCASSPRLILAGRRL